MPRGRWMMGLAVVAMVLTTATARAQTPLEGTFVAGAECPALQSIRRGTNPGGVATEPGWAYPLVGVNGERATHYQIVVAEAPAPQRRWVAIDCGTRADAAARSAPAARAATSTRNVLALSWQPAFCEVRPGVPECRRLNGPGGARLPAAQAFSLHGLWPQPHSREFCGVDGRVRESDERGRWSALPAPRVDRETAAALDVAMPGTRSALDRHEWIRHGTCYGASADAYFDDSLFLLEAVNASAVRALFARSIGRRLSAQDVRDAFDEAFGEGAGRAVELGCEGGNITELKLHLNGRIVVGESRLGALLRAAGSAPRGCRGGRVDAAGR
ncbi:ribonuclease T2 family protein [Acuticoccus mangrovi]|uniref:Ribonuclease T n=1 Tax=Acuticoccus mangrovi TaxID=2796142 RepID=A0A934MLV7_9HYPH|nr:ribonuclease T [Acuticoccus mangrovi]MBJ3776714.1 ribonuclease T [Acuticoccus mangrovi]